jgi:hypothetical protein
MNLKTDVLDVRQYAAQYELLRAQVTGTPRDGVLGREACQQRAVGLALLLREGLPGWLKAVAALLRGSLAAPAPEASAGGVRPALEGCAADAAVATASFPVHYHDLTLLLTSLVLSTRHLPGLPPSEGGCRACQ